MAQELILADGEQLDETVSYDIADGQVRIALGNNARATVELTVRGAVEVIATLQADANLTVLCIQTEEATLVQRAHLSTNAAVHWQNVSLAPVTHSLETRAEGPHARSDVDWMFYAKGEERQAIRAHNIFEAEGGSGEMTMKGVAEGTAYVRLDGMINIGLKGRGTDTYLTEDVLMLDRSAKVDAIPGLEIKTNDVKASHSATVSKVTPEDLFYFAARGIDEHEARNMYVRGFLGEIAANIEKPETQERVLRHIERKYAA